jgi:hypothetical protein
MMEKSPAPRPITFSVTEGFAAPARGVFILLIRVHYGYR